MSAKDQVLDRVPKARAATYRDKPGMYYVHFGELYSKADSEDAAWEGALEFILRYDIRWKI